MTRTKKRHWGDVFLVLFLLAGAVASIVGCVNGMREAGALTAGAVKTRGVIVDMTRAHGGDTSDRLSIRYTYVVDGVTCEGYERIRSEDAFMALQRGDVIPVYYAENAPSSSAAFDLPSGCDRFCLVGEGALAALLLMMACVAGLMMVRSRFLARPGRKAP